jgi:hypothetical protein
MTQDELKELIADLRLNHEYCPKEVILQAADELERLAQPGQEPCDMGAICIGCSPRNADGSCPSSQRTWND